MDEEKIRNYFFYLACIVVIIAGVKIASEIVIVLFLAIFISSIISTLIKILDKRHIPKLISYLLVLGFFTLISLLLAYIVNISLKDFITNLPTYEEKLQQTIVNIISLAENYGYSIDKKTILDALNLNSFFGITTNLIGSIGTFLSKFLLIIIGIGFILAESKSFEKKLKILFRKESDKIEHFNLFFK